MTLSRYSLSGFLRRSMHNTTIILLTLVCFIATTDTRAAVKTNATAVVMTFSPASGAPGTLVTINRSGLNEATGVSIGGKAAIIISGGDSQIIAMVMPGAVTGKVKVSVPAGTATSTTDFTVTETPHPTGQTGPKLVDTTTYPKAVYLNGGTPPPGGVRYKSVNQGYNVAVSADGNSAVVSSMTGLNYDDPRYGGQGSLTFYEKQAGAWKKVRFYAPPTDFSLQIGRNLSLNADGTVLVTSGDNLEPVRIYEKQNGTWQRTGFFGVGSNASVSADGNSVVLGFSRVVQHKGSTEVNEYTSVFHRVNGSWVSVEAQSAVAVVDFGAGAMAGSRVAISGDAKTLAVTSYFGYTYIMKYNGTSWVLQKKLSVAGGLTFNADGNLLVESFSGSTSFYTRVNGVWSKAQDLPETGKPSVTADGKVVMFPGYNGPVTYIRNTARIWQKQDPGSLTTPANNISISADGTTAISGFPQDTTAGKILTKQYVLDPYGSSTITDSTYVTYAYGSATTYGVNAIAAPTGYATLLKFTNTTNTSTTLSWTSGNGGSRAVFLHLNSASYPVPADYTAYTANGNFGAGSQIGNTGWYCVYDGTGNSVDITGLAASSKYYAAVVEYNGVDGNQRYYTASGAPASVTTLAPAVAQATNLTFSNTTGISTSLSWTNGTGSGRVVFVNQTNSGTPLPADVYYSANGRYHSGQQIGTTGWFCVYNGTGNTANVVGLTSGATYRAAVLEYTGTIDKPKYVTTDIAAATLTTPIQAPTGYAINVKFSNTTPNSTTVTWTSGNGAARAVFMRAGYSGLPGLTNGHSYSPNSTFGAGELATPAVWYCIYVGTGSTVNVSGLSASTQYRVAVMEYNGTAGNEAYITTSNPGNFTTPAAPVIMASINSNSMMLNKTDGAVAGGQVVANNILSPNGDGRNDTWVVSNIEAYPNNNVTVVDGGGNVVFTKKGYNNDWAGTYRGTTLAEGTYYYTIDLGNSTKLKGFITVVRDR